MVTSYRMLVVSTCLMSGVSLALLITAFATESWITATAKYIPTTNVSSIANGDSIINYGLFKGTLLRKVPSTSSKTHDIHIACLMIKNPHNKCAFSCKGSRETREAELLDLIEGKGPDEVPFLCNTAQLRDSQIQQDQKEDGQTKLDSSERHFIDANIWLCTILFLSIAVVMAMTSTVFSVVNMAANPVERIFGVFGLYVWNGIAGVCDLMVLLLWGVLYSVSMSNDVSIRDTLVGQFTTRGLADLGYSYWLVFISMVLHCCNVLVLYLRQWLLNREPPAPTIPLEDNADGFIFLY